MPVPQASIFSQALGRALRRQPASHLLIRHFYPSPAGLDNLSKHIPETFEHQTLDEQAIRLANGPQTPSIADVLSVPATTDNDSSSPQSADSATPAKPHKPVTVRSIYVEPWVPKAPQPPPVSDFLVRLTKAVYSAHPPPASGNIIPPQPIPDDRQPHAGTIVHRQLSHRLTLADRERIKAEKEIFEEEERSRGEPVEEGNIHRRTGRLPRVFLRIDGRNIQVRAAMREDQLERDLADGKKIESPNVGKNLGPSEEELAREALRREEDEVDGEEEPATPRLVIRRMRGLPKDVEDADLLDPMKRMMAEVLQEQKRLRRGERSTMIPAAFTVLTKSAYDAQTAAEKLAAEVERVAIEAEEKERLRSLRKELKHLRRTSAIHQGKKSREAVEVEENDPPDPYTTGRFNPQKVKDLQANLMVQHDNPTKYGHLVREEYQKNKQEEEVIRALEEGRTPPVFDSDGARRPTVVSVPRRRHVPINVSSLPASSPSITRRILTAQDPRAIGKNPGGSIRPIFHKDWSLLVKEGRTGSSPNVIKVGTAEYRFLTREEYQARLRHKPARSTLGRTEAIQPHQSSGAPLTASVTGLPRPKENSEVFTQEFQPSPRLRAKAIAIGTSVSILKIAGNGPKARYYSTDAHGLKIRGSPIEYTRLPTMDQMDEIGTSDEPEAVQYSHPVTKGQVQEGTFMKGLPSKFWITERPALFDLLRQLGFCEDMPAFFDFKANLSHTDPLLHVTKRTRENRNRFQGDMGRERDTRGSKNLAFLPQLKAARKTKLTLKEITMNYIYEVYRPHILKPEEHVEPWNHEALGNVFTPTVRAFLDRRGFTEKDVHAWAWVLMSKDATISGMRMHLYHAKTGCIFPAFVVMHVLRRPRMKRDALVSIMPIITQLFEQPVTTPNAMDQKTMIVLLIRLHRRMREVWPVGMPELLKYWDKIYQPGNKPLVPEWVTHTHNRFLGLLSYPPQHSPYEFAAIIQECLFGMVQQMTDKGIVITREGYRAITHTMLAQKKLASEKDTVRNMGINWPPWPVERDGRHALQMALHSNLESRPLQALSQMMEAGFSPKDWEKGASILGGRDTDGTPTVQTRTHLKPSTIMAEGNTSTLWAARVRATRTMEEAWWTFIEYKSHLDEDTRPAQSVYIELLAKSIWRGKMEERLQAENIAQERVEQKISGNLEEKDENIARLRIWLDRRAESNYNNVPGDGKEVHPPPLNPTDGAYTWSEPATPAQLMEMMREDGIRFNTTITTRLLEYAPDHKFATGVLKAWDIDKTNALLLPLHKGTITGNIESIFTRDPKTWPVFTAFLDSLGRRDSMHRSLDHQLILLRHHRPCYTPAWNIALESLTKVVRKWTIPIQRDILNNVWSMFNEMSTHVDPNKETLHIMATAVEKHGIYEMHTYDSLWDDMHPADRFMELFRKEVMGSPQLLIPYDALYHATIRALGFSQRYDEIEEILRFIAKNDYDFMGERVGRIVLVSAKVFLEGAAKRKPRQPDLEVLRRCNQLVEETWGDWGGDEKWLEKELDNYCLMGRLARGPGDRDVEE